jgi:transposase-like protein
LTEKKFIQTRIANVYLFMEQKALEKSVSQNGVFQGRDKRYFSEELRRHIVKEIEDGVYNKSEASRVYGVSNVCIYKWLHKYSLKYQKGIVTVVELESESVKRKKLEQQQADSHKIIAAQTVELFFYKQLVEVMSEHFDFKKNINSMSLDGLTQIKKQLDKKVSI